ncbi:MAG: hypothetical protein AAFR71_02045 [Pseudomonadota bacterium]
MAKEFGRLARRQIDTAYSRYIEALKVGTCRPKSTRLDENLAWFSYFTLVITAAIHFAPEATAKPIAQAVMGIL